MVLKKIERLKSGVGMMPKIKWLTLALVLLACGGCGDDGFQKTGVLLPNGVEVIEALPSGLPGVALYVPIQPAHFRGTLPDECTLEVTLGDHVSETWRLVRAVAYEYSEPGVPFERAIYAPICGASAQGRPSKVRISDLAPNAWYRVKLSLEPRGGDVTDYFNTRAGIDKDMKLDVLKAKYGLIMRESRGDLMTPGAVMIFAKPGVEKVKARVQ